MKETTSNQLVDAGIAQKGDRKPYIAPKLRRLGSVRELTFGSSPFATADVATMASMAPM